MPDTPPTQGAKCPRCGTAVPESLLRRLGGACSKCLFEFAGEPDLPEFPNLEILGPLGKGGMGVVYKARQTRLNRTVAVKVLSERLMEEPQFIERFEREAAAMALLSHPNIVAIHDSGVHGGIPYLVMEYVEGTPLRKLLGKGPIEPRRALDIAASLCDALRYAHGRGVIHRDIKPENILIDKDGRVKVADFGLARLTHDETTPITLTGARLGTPSYMSPEQVERSAKIDHRADLYALGVVLYELLTGGLPIGHFKPPSKVVDVDHGIDRLVLRLLEKLPDSRPQSAAEAQAEIVRLRAGKNWTAMGLAATAVLAVVAILLGFWLRKTPESPAPAAVSSATPPAPPIPAPDGWTEIGGSATGPGLSIPRGPSYRPCMRLDRRGWPVAAWRDDSSGNAEIFLRRWDGKAWVELGGSASGGGISRTSSISREPCVAIDAEDRPVVTWFEEANGNFEVYLRRWDGQTWAELDGSGSGGGLSRNGSRSVHPVVAIDPKGNPVVAWYCIPRFGPVVFSAREVYLRRWDGQHWVELGGSASGGGVSKNRGDSYMPSLAIDRNGNPSVLWHDNTPGNFDIYFKRWTGSEWEELDGSASGGGISHNDGASMTANTGCLALDPQGNPVAVWDDDSSGHKEIYCKRWNGTAWVELGESATGGGVSRSNQRAIHPSVAVDLSGRPCVSWQDNDASDKGRIYLRAWTGTAWSPLGMSDSGGGISRSPAHTFEPSLAIDPEGQPVVAWNDWRVPTASIYIKRWTPPSKPR